MTSLSEPQRGLRQKRFKRNEDAMPMRMTPRDLDALRALARFRFLSSRQVQALVGGSEQQMLRRLRSLYDHGFIERPRAQLAELAHFFDTGNRPLVYAIASKGARSLASNGYGAIDKLDWTTKNARASADFLAHTLETADVMIGFETVCREDNALRLVDHHALLPYLPHETQTDAEPFRLDVEVRVSKAAEPLPIAVIPDRLFSLLFGSEARLNFALELDRGTMDVRARQLVGKSSFRRKLLGYWHAWRADAHTTRWGFKSFRVLTVTTSEARIKTMLEAQCEIVGPQGSNMFAFTTPQRLVASGPLGPAWISGKGEALSLCPADWPQVSDSARMRS